MYRGSRGQHRSLSLACGLCEQFPAVFSIVVRPAACALGAAVHIRPFHLCAGFLELGRVSVGTQHLV